MARTTGPLMSLDASGSLAKTLTFSRWKGRSYVRQLVIPHNPKTGLQIAFRAMMKFLSQRWSTMTGAEQATWDTQAASFAISPFNAFVKANQRGWGEALAPGIEYPITRTTTPGLVTSTIGTGGVRTATVTTILAAGATEGYILYRDLNTPVPMTQDQAIAVIYEIGGNTNVYQDSPLTPDTYYYRAVPFSHDGKLGTAGATSAGVVVS